MATVPKQRRTREVDYPTTDGKPMGESEIHIDELIDAITVLKDRFAGEPNVYVNGNMLLYYEEGNPRKHVSPDVLVALNVPKKPKRDYYLVWKEGICYSALNLVSANDSRNFERLRSRLGGKVQSGRLRPSHQSRPGIPLLRQA